jgi:hypothetical protein
MTVTPSTTVADLCQKIVFNTLFQRDIANDRIRGNSFVATLCMNPQLPLNGMLNDDFTALN